ncbi:LOW QUALITY PROTEIN: uncharacterized protein si:ch211-248a14.8 [Rhincodon typus]|uniref:LOW QUALITY PROTEIN: uncharacterized protein si:ch211-248a14.8 n=1 Tax=Rhincodon typus TaxID=259920 RepID=UPI00202DC5C0|nr:LOW QUALITY PROTEIN: uncharacterized protein si:ch211-248a14.8 [Rhincodon typus]
MSLKLIFNCTPVGLPRMVAAVPVQNSASSWLLCGSWLLGPWAGYTLCSGCSEFFNGVFINQYRFGFPAFIALCQALLTIVVLQLLSQARLLKIQPYSLESGETFLLPSICFSFHSLLTLWAVTSSNSIGFNFIRQFTPLATLVLMEIFNLKKRTSSNTTFLVLLVTLCSVLAGLQNFNDEALVYAYGVLNLVFKSTYLILIQKICEDHKTSVLQKREDNGEFSCEH